MAVSMNVDYTRQLYTGLSTDDWGDVEFFEGDVVYIMDQSQCWICDGTTMHQLPDLGGGGGGDAYRYTKLAEGTFTLTTDNQSMMTVPISYSGSAILYLLAAENGNSLSGTWAWHRWFNTPDFYPSDISDIISAIQYGFYGSSSAAVTSMSVTASDLKAYRWNNSTNIRAQTYNWFIYGRET